MTDRWDEGDAYERFMGRWSRLVATRFLAWLAAPPGAAWLDIGSGTGALLHAVGTTSSPSRLAGLDPSERFLEVAAATLPAEAELHVGDAARLPFGRGDFDVVVSGLVLNFLPNPEGALAEMHRVCRPSGTVAAYVWDYAEGMQYLRCFWDAATDLDPDANPLDEGHRRFPLCRPEPLAALFTSAGLTEVTTTAIDVERRFERFEDYWLPFLAGQGPAGTYVAGLSEEQRAALGDRLRVSLPIGPDGSIRLGARAWGVRGRA